MSYLFNASLSAGLVCLLGGDSACLQLLPVAQTVASFLNSSAILNGVNPLITPFIICDKMDGEVVLVVVSVLEGPLIL